MNLMYMIAQPAPSELHISPAGRARIRAAQSRTAPRESKYTLLVLAFAALTLCAAGCQRNIVRASPPSVSSPPPAASTPAQAPPSPPQTTNAPPATPAPEPPATPAPQPAPARTRPAAPAPTEPEKPAETSRPAAPEISPELTPEAKAAAEQHTYADIQHAEQNLQKAEGKQLDSAQHDLVEKVRDFLSQAHDAIHADDWIRAGNLAEKARILSDELAKSL